MGTRGVIGFRVDGQDKVMYNHFDSYPFGLGQHAVDVVQKYSFDELKETAERIELVNANDEPSDEVIKRYLDFSDTSVSTGVLTDWYVLLRHAQGRLDFYVDGSIDHMLDSQDFLEDSLVCEWAYIVNVDHRMFEVYKGFNENPDAPGRYASKGQSGDHGYWGASFVDSIDLGYLQSLSEKDTDTLIASWEPGE